MFVLVVVALTLAGFAVSESVGVAPALVARLVSQFADSSDERVLGAPRELGEVQFHAVWHPRVDEDPSHSWLRQVVHTSPRHLLHIAGERK